MGISTEIAKLVQHVFRAPQTGDVEEALSILEKASCLRAARALRTLVQAEKDGVTGEEFISLASKAFEEAGLVAYVFGR